LSKFDIKRRPRKVREGKKIPVDVWEVEDKRRLGGCIKRNTEEKSKFNPPQKDWERDYKTASEDGKETLRNISTMSYLSS
jgi:hypothetical protein